MRKQLSRDDNHYDRLSSFLLWEGNLEIKKLHQIKRNIYYLEANTGKQYILKGHSNLLNMRQQWDFFNKAKSKSIVPFVRFPNGKKEILTGTNYGWTISPYITGRKLNYQHPGDRLLAVSTIKKFHQDAKNITVKNPIKKQLFYRRWHVRLNKFLETEYIFQKYGYENLFRDIVWMMNRYLDIVSTYSWNHDQKEAEIEGRWVHGDVASHNFIHNERTVLIDFDLLHCTTQLYDFIQLGQRFLPNINWKLDRLLQYNMASERELAKFLYSVFIPSDVLREWMHYLKSKRRLSVSSYLQTMEEEWIKRKEFLNTSKVMLK
ncbi:phosphotransferase [Ornithinibacillus bavariensis]|uniref:phosphotransferase n=1 Tax=Ornithinibacillus bavariensis TaxID=545502 RepID=UPI000EC578AB|nr:hypothetical protein [Ornithinibacillus sp.]